MLGGLALELCFPALFISTSFISAHEGSGQPPLCPSATSLGQVSAGGAWPQCQSKAFQSTSGSKLSAQIHLFPTCSVAHLAVGMGRKNKDNRTRDNDTAKSKAQLQWKVLGFGMS